MGAAPIHAMIEDTPPYMGGLLSTLTLGLVGKKKPKVLTHDEILSQMAIVVSDRLNSNGQSADVGKIKESLGFNLNSFGAWDAVVTDVSGATTETVVRKVIADLLNSGLILVSPGYSNAGAVIDKTGAVIGASNGTAFALNPTMLMAGLGLGALVLLKGGRRGRR